jgi:hypothetical protein
MRNRGNQTRIRLGSRVRLEPGSHRSPDDGVCIVELASIIGGEPFSDRPACVCRVLGSFLRGWNDRAGYADRQRLQPYASRVVGTGGYPPMSRIRRDICLRWAGADLDRGPLGRLGARLRVRARIAWTVGVWSAIRLEEGAGAYAARVCFARGGSAEAFALLDRMLEVGALRRSTNGNGHRRDELGIRATIVARERGSARSPAAPVSGSAPAADADRPRGRQAARPGARSSR